MRTTGYGTGQALGRSLFQATSPPRPFQLRHLHAQFNARLANTHGLMLHEPELSASPCSARARV